MVAKLNLGVCAWTQARHRAISTSGTAGDLCMPSRYISRPSSTIAPAFCPLKSWRAMVSAASWQEAERGFTEAASQHHLRAGTGMLMASMPLIDATGTAAAIKG